ncbi:Tda11p [Saccharomyces eubayanus]|uniref:Tda11p n=1 Tax=Saccharomyces eubayanus TaxID=1080349 RepID=UPI0006BFD664|nr:TDA11-like protein [Saccharomyces eubayanus]KOG99219.1 TDA11-like protein [Saccharomyces eubayanus]
MNLPVSENISLGTNMNKFDEFIESNEKDLETDTSTRSSIASMSPVVKPGPKIHPAGHNGYKPEHHRTSSAGSMHSQRLMTPTRLNEQDHPLQTKPGARRVVTRHSSVSMPNAIGKRRSLIQPMVVPTTPESQSNISFGNPLTYSDGSHGIPVESTTLLSSEQAMGGSLRHSRNGSSQSVNSLATPSMPTIGVDVSALLQALATKELELLECKQKVEDLKKQTQYEEQTYSRRARELQELKQQVSKHLDPSQNTPVKDRNFSPALQNIPMESRFENGGNGSFTNSARPRQDKISPNAKQSGSVSPQGVQDTHPGSSSADLSKQSLWSKPLALFNQFDQIIQHEIERTLNWDEKSPGPPEPQQPPSTGNHDSTVRHHISEPSETDQEPSSQGSVSRSLWSFVSDVKAGLLGIEEENDSDVTNDNRNGLVNKSGRQYAQKQCIPKVSDWSQPEESGDDSSLGMKKFKTIDKFKTADDDREHRAQARKRKTGTNKLQFVGDNYTNDTREGSPSTQNPVEMANL